MFHSTIQSICTIVLPKPSFKVTPSQPDPIYYTGLSLRRNSYDPNASYPNFNVSTSSVAGFGHSIGFQGQRTPQQDRRSLQTVASGRSLSKASPSSSHNQCHLSRRSSRNSTCCCSCSCPYDVPKNHSHEYHVSEFGMLTAVTSSLLESPAHRSPPQYTPRTRQRSIHSTKTGKPRPVSFPSMETPSPVTPARKKGHTRSRSYDHPGPTTSRSVQASCTKPMGAPQNVYLPQLDSVPDSLDTFRRLRRSKRISYDNSPSDHAAASDRPENSLTTNSVRSFDFLETLKRSSLPSNHFDSSGSSCSSFDASDGEGAYPSTALSSPAKIPSRMPNRSSQAYPDAIPMFALSPILEDSSLCEDVDAILVACYSDSPILGRTTTPQGYDHNPSDIDDADWQPEVVFEPDLAAQIQGVVDKVDDNADPSLQKPCEKTSFVHKSTCCGSSSRVQENHEAKRAYNNLLSPPALMLTFPTPEMEYTAEILKPEPLKVGPRRLSIAYTAPHTPPTPRTPFADSTNLRPSMLPDPPTPMPPLPRCISCGFGFGFDVTGSMEVLPSFDKNGSRPPCKDCSAQWEKCCKWYGKRGWAVGKVGDSSREVDEGAPQPQEGRPRTEKMFRHSSRRLSQMIENTFLFSLDSRPGSGSTGQDSKRHSECTSFWGSGRHRSTGGASTDHGNSRATADTERPAEHRRRRTGTENGDLTTNQAHRRRYENICTDALAKKSVKTTWRNLTGKFSRSGVAPRKRENAWDATTRRRSFLDFSGTATDGTAAKSQKRRSHGGFSFQHNWR